VKEYKILINLRRDQQKEKVHTTILNIYILLLDFSDPWLSLRPAQSRAMLKSHAYHWTTSQTWTSLPVGGFAFKSDIIYPKVLKGIIGEEGGFAHGSGFCQGLSLL
jgi:hypothetical protein